MASYVVDGLVLPVSVGGHPVLDFCNTRAGWGSPTLKEYLHTYTHLTRWATENGLVDPTTLARLTRLVKGDPAAGERVAARAVAFRSALYAVLVGPGGPSDWAGVNAEVRAAAVTATLAPASSMGAAGGAAVGAGAGKSARLARGVDDGAPARWRYVDVTVELPLLTVAWAAAGLLTSPTGATVRACPGEGCGWVFTDPRGRRRWCSMAWCGNRNKARRYAERRRDPADAG